MKPSIVDRGRGPEIAGSRITVYDVLAETRAGISASQLAREWNLSIEQLECAFRYIDEHREEVEREWAEIQARHDRRRREFEEKYGAVLAGSHEKLVRAKAAFDRRRAEESDHARASGGHQHPGANGDCPPDLHRT